MPAVANSLCRLLSTYSRLAPTERGSYRLVRAARRLIPVDQWQQERITPDGLALQLDLGTYPDCSMAFGLYELDTVRLLRKLLHRGDWFVDCGANLGYFTMLAAKWIGEGGRVDAFEPDPLNLQRLEAHLQRNNLAGRVRVHICALGDRAAQVQLYHPIGRAYNHGMASLYRAGAEASSVRQFSVKVLRLDDVLDGIPNLIKLDIEGAELSALQGMQRILSSGHPPRLIIEHNPQSFAAAGYSPSDLMRLLLRLQPRYRLYLIGWRLKRIYSPQVLDRLQRVANLLVDSAP